MKKQFLKIIFSYFPSIFCLLFFGKEKECITFFSKIHNFFYDAFENVQENTIEYIIFRKFFKKNFCKIKCFLKINI